MVDRVLKNESDIQTCLEVVSYSRYRPDETDVGDLAGRKIRLR